MRNFLLCCVLLLLSVGAKASHVVGADLYYTWITGNQYKVTVVIYGDCGPSSASAFSTLPTGSPRVCVYDGATNLTTLNLTIQAPSAGVEITPVCPADSLNTQCHTTSSLIPGIKKFVYSTLYTVPYTSANWRFIYTGYMGASSAGRAAAITNLNGPGGTTLSLEAKLNNTGAINSNPILTILPVPFFCLNGFDSYNPGAVDADGDSLTFALVAPTNFTAGTGCSGTSPLCTYLTTYPYSATNPLHTFPGTFGFDPATGQISFQPDILQRSAVVYTINEYRNNVFVGSMQREMSFTVLTCTSPPPTGGLTGVTNGTIDDSTHFHICAETGPFNITLSSTEADTSLSITVTNTGVPPGCTFTVTGNGTPHPMTNISWTSTGVTPGIYTFYVTFTDNACPIKGSQTRAFTISIFPIPTLAYTVIQDISCAGDAIVSITPGGLGSPWAVDVLNGAGGLIHTRTGITGTYLDTLAAGNDTLVIYSAVSSFCNSRLSLVITPAPFVTPAATFTNPTYCGNSDGTITITGLNPLELDSMTYTLNGVPMPAQAIFSSSTGTYVLTGLCAGTYSNIVIRFGTCVAPPIGAMVLTNPPFTMSYIEFTNPTACGFNNGSIRVHGLHPYQLDTLRYNYNGVPQTPVAVYVNADSMITLTNLLDGTYSNFIANSTGACPTSPTGCTSNMLGPVTLVAPGITPAFTYDIHLGCAGDTVNFTNFSSPLTPVPLFYRWYFGDGGTDTSRNPTHIYHPTAGTTYTVKLIITNTKCSDSTFQSFTVPGPVHALFTSVPDTFLCQASTVTLTNGSTGANPVYSWNFGDGTTSAAINPTHVYPNTGIYTITLEAIDTVGCVDSFKKVIQVDSTSIISVKASDSVICNGGLVTFEGTYTTIGLLGTIWQFGDGSTYLNANPIQHAFDATGNIAVTLTVTYRACATVTITRNLRIYANPTIYLGPDATICPGGEPVYISDALNAANPLATWLWNTGETTSNITVTNPGYYSATVTINGCVATDTVWVANDCYVSFPNIFTPNGDGVNDYFFPRNLLTRGLIDFHMQIYNRWGQLVYETTSIDGQGWDGKFNNIAQPEGVFIYKIDAMFKDGQKLNKQGNVTLTR